MTKRNSTRRRQTGGKQLLQPKNMAEEIAMVVYDVVRREMRKYFIKSSCIATTRIVVNLFEHFGFEAAPIHVDTSVWNPAWVNALRCGDQPPYSLSKEATDRWMDERAAWNVGTNDAAMDEPVRHLVAYIPALSCLIDASIDQFNRPARKINLPKCVRFYIDPESLNSAHTWRIQRNSCWIYYSRVVDDREAWRLSSDWTGNAGTAAVQSALIRRVEKITGRKAVEK
jgi:hypothetical protein